MFTLVDLGSERVQKNAQIKMLFRVKMKETLE